jgi:hypothetical protein
MPDARTIADQQLLEMRWRCLSLAADLDRIERATGGVAALSTDPRLITLQKALAALLEPGPNRAQRVQMLFSDRTPGPNCA